MKKVFLLLITILLITVDVFPQTEIKIANPGFEEVNKDWKITGGGNVSYDNLFHSGSKSISVNHPDWNQTTISSEEVKMKVGHVYKLSAWAKTESVYSNNYDQYPTPVAGCATMESFPFTNSSTTIGSTKDWQKLEVMFVAIKSTDKVQLHLGYNGKAKGKIWFDDLTLEEVTDISQYIPLETVKWSGPAFRYEDKGWIFVHIEGKPYQRGFQYGSLVADEIKAFIEKLAVSGNAADPASAWNQRRFGTDAIFLRKYEEEYLTEMKGIAEGAAKAGAKVFDRPVDFLDIVAINSAVDLDYVQSALGVTPNPLTGKSFLANEDELNVQERLHKCSSFLANNSATKDGKIVFGQLFMWGGYTGYHWNILCDVVPSEGNRLVYQTFPGGIHSGSDFYINSAGIMIGETTVQQTPYNEDGIPQSNRIRKAAQYANNIDDVVKIMTTKNNGMYTNDWLIGDVKKNEIGILILGTNKWKLWRSSKQDWYNDAKDFYWSDNNNKDLEVRKEYIVNAEDSPVDITFRPVNRDIAFWNFYQAEKGNIDHQAAINLWNSSPINRPHACDGKVTTSEMAEQMVFLLHNGKVTLREQMVGENGRMPDLPNAVPRLTLGYAAASPIFIADKLKERKDKLAVQKPLKDLPNSLNDVKEIYSFDKEKLWKGTIYPAADKDNWFASSTAAYYNLLKQIPVNLDAAFNYTRDELTELNYRLLYVFGKEGSIAPLDAKIIYDKYNNYQIPRIKGTYLLHQLRLRLGNDLFSKAMKSVHDQFKEKDVTTEQIISSFEKSSGISLNDFMMQWLSRDDLPDVDFTSSVEPAVDGWKLKLNIKQNGKTYNFLTTISIESGKEKSVKQIEIKKEVETIEIILKEKPGKIVFNYGNDIPVNRKKFFTYQNLFDDYANVMIVYGTTQQVEANHTIALRYQRQIADRFTEVFSPIRKDCEVDEKNLRDNDLVILGGVSDNSLTKKIIVKLGLESGKYFFKWMGEIYSKNDDGLYLTFPNPFNNKKAVYMFIGNSAQQLYQMTKRHQPVPAWGLFKGDKLIKKGYQIPDQFEKTIN
jgi:hypothetical protein